MSNDKEKESSDANRSHDDEAVAADMPADPDAHLTAAEKAEVVCFGR